MSRKKMITFDSDEYLSQVKKRMKQKEDVCFERMAKLTNMKEDTVRSWFRSGRIPEYEKSILDIYLETGRKMKKVLPAPKKEAELPLVEMCEKAIVSIGGEVVEEVPIVPVSQRDLQPFRTASEMQKCPYPRTMFFIQHAYDYDFTGDERCAYIQTLGMMLRQDAEVNCGL